MKKLLHILSVLVLATGCVEVIRPTVPENNLRTEFNTVSINFGINLPAPVQTTKTMSDDPDISSLHVAVFDDGGMLSEYVECELEGTVYAEHNATLNEGPRYSYKVNLSASDTKRILHFIANGPSSLKYGSEVEVMGKLITSGSDDAYWQRIEVANLKADDNGNLNSTIKNQLSDICLIRNFARITISAEGATGFELVSFQTIYTMDSGSVAAYNRTTGNFQSSYQNAAKPDALISVGYKGNVPASAKLNETLSTKEYDSHDNFTAYIYEREIPTTKPTYVIVKGIYKKADPNNTTPTYYKIDLVNEKGEYFPFLRNFDYKINIYEVNRPGSDTAEHAVVNAGSGGITTSLDARNLTNISDGTSRLFVDYTDKVLVGSSAVTLRFKYIPNLYFDADDDEIADIHNEWVTASAGEAGASGEVILLDDTHQITISPTDDPDGYRTVTFTPTSVSHLVKTQSMILRGKVPDGNVAEVFGDLPHMDMVREIAYTLRERMSIIAKCSPKEIDQKINTPVDFTFKIPEGIPASVFSLDFLIEVKDLTLQTNDDPLPIKTGKSLISGQTDKPAFQFLKTISWSEYQEAPTDIDGFKSFTCHFKSNTARSDSQIYIFNDFFDTSSADAHDSFSTYVGSEFQNLRFTKPEHVHEGDVVEFSFHTSTSVTAGNITVALKNFVPAFGLENNLTYIGCDTENDLGLYSLPYDPELFPDNNFTIKLEADNYEGNASVGLSAYRFVGVTSESVPIEKAKIFNNGWGDNCSPDEPGSKITYHFNLETLPQTNGGKAKIYLTNLEPDNDARLISNGDGTYSYVPEGTSSTIASTQQVLNLKAIDYDAVGITIEIEHFLASVTDELANKPRLASPDVSYVAKATTIDFSWPAVANATSYNVYWGDMSGEPVASSSDRTYSVDHLDPDTTYHLYVVAVGNPANYLNSRPTESSPKTKVQVEVGTPTVTLSESSTSTLTFTWNAVSHATGYHIFFDGVDSGVVTGTSKQFTDLASKSTHTISVYALGDGNEYIDSTTPGENTSTTKEGNAGRIYITNLTNNDLSIGPTNTARSTDITNRISSTNGTTAADKANITFTSDNEEIATVVNQNGNYIAVVTTGKVGTATISMSQPAKGQYGVATGSFTVTVYKNTFTLEISSFSMLSLEQKQFTVSGYTGSGWSRRTVTIPNLYQIQYTYSDNSYISSISQDYANSNQGGGVVHVHAYLPESDNYGPVETDFDITVNKRSPSITLGKDSITLKIDGDNYPSEDIQITGCGDYRNGGNNQPTYEYSSSNTNVCTVSNGRVQSVGSGESIITVSIPENNYSYAASKTFKVYVKRVLWKRIYSTNALSKNQTVLITNSANNSILKNQYGVAVATNETFDDTKEYNDNRFIVNDVKIKDYQYYYYKFASASSTSAKLGIGVAGLNIYVNNSEDDYWQLTNSSDWQSFRLINEDRGRDLYIHGTSVDANNKATNIMIYVLQN